MGPFFLNRKFKLMIWATNGDTNSWSFPDFHNS
jgi:hypothetical protein